MIPASHSHAAKPSANRVVRPGGEIKVMLYNRRGLYALKMWVKRALLKGQPFHPLQ